MGVGMQIVYLDLVDSAMIEAEAGVQLVRLERFGKTTLGCHLAIETVRDGPRRVLYDSRPDLIARPNELIPVRHCPNQAPHVA